ncbi:GIY-YIG nuclease family protein [Sulfuricella denitrificans]|uniref:GIY-YIG nuclease family protein n=1 Tax=Sulfuricella denitrificans TaxID=649841 RepID=UPI000A052BB5|nr:GIY-YIG nuclease family protein [Sulfuricella denitrificans]
MNAVFRQFIESLEPSFQRLMRMDPVTVATLPRETPLSGIYLFSENERHLYVGRTNTIKKRLQNHCRPSSGHNSATFAFRLARQITGHTIATYTEHGSRSFLEKHPDFSHVFLQQKERVRNMDVRYVFEPDPMRQALLEMYVSVSLGTPHNDFDNH